MSSRPAHGRKPSGKGVAIPASAIPNTVANLISKGFDTFDRAPEDRVNPQCERQMDPVSAFFGPYEPVVRGSLHIEGVNYAKYEAHKHRAKHVVPFLDALRDDIISEVGNGVRREDILLQIFPGAIKAVVLHYNKIEIDDQRDDGEYPLINDPKLVDAEWSVKCDYAIRARDVQRQQNIAIAIYTALGSEETFSTHKMSQVYRRLFDPNNKDDIRIVRPPDLQAGAGQQSYQTPQQQQQQQQPRLIMSPQRNTAVPSPYIPQTHRIVDQQQQQQQHQQQNQSYQRGAEVVRPLLNDVAPGSDIFERTLPANSSITPQRARRSPLPPMQAHQNTSMQPTMGSYQPDQIFSDLEEAQPILMPETEEGWSSVNGKRGITVFIPETALKRSSKRSTQGYTRTPNTGPIPFP
eukprot:TRINITY_DN17305_c0_g1_i1.p1 TRINITY_DN17305_c0_g1~~TRINITY_DN17305_c0_g1_i1.p1  ORF type:complete len:476 (+),score=83.99 TRINITY_DN17305_c0_g1_i1:210-1430(+)